MDVVTVGLSGPEGSEPHDESSADEITNKRVDANHAAIFITISSKQLVDESPPIMRFHYGSKYREVECTTSIVTCNAYGMKEGKDWGLVAI